MNDKLHKLLTHEKTRDLLGRIARGDDPRQAVAHLAGSSLAETLARALGAAPAPSVDVTPGPPAAGAKTKFDDGVIDAEFRVINVTEQAKKANRGKP